MNKFNYLLVTLYHHSIQYRSFYEFVRFTIYGH